MSKSPIRVLVVDDSLLLRELLSDIIESDPGFTVVAKARDGQDALRKMEQYRPDVVTLDVQMPGMDGLATLDAMLEKCPVPAVMVSALTTRDADVTLKALERGALDYIAKPDRSQPADTEFRETLLRKLKAIAGADVKRILRIRKSKRSPNTGRRASVAAGAPPETSLDYSHGCVAVGISTGGPPALSQLFQSIELPLPPLVIVQHMPANFTGAFAARLDSISAVSVKEAATGDRLQPNHAYVARGGQHLILQKRGHDVVLRVKQGQPVSGHMPSVDVMMQSAAEIYGSRCVGVIMTGMGHDGVEGCRAIRAAGGYVLGQDEATSDVYGMNHAAYAAGHVHEQFSLDDLPATLAKTCRQRLARRPRTAASAVR